MNENNLRWWEQFTDLCQQLQEYPKSDWMDLIKVEITLLYSIGKRSWVSALLKEDKQQSDSANEEEDDNENLINMKKYVVHLMFPAAVSVGENLPNIDTVSFHIAHWYCYIESPKLPDRCISKMAKTFHGTLAECAVARVPDPTASLQKELRDLLQSEKPLPNNIIGKLKLQGTLVRMDGQGEIVGKRVKNLPTKRTRKEYCRKLFESIMTIRPIQDFLLQQSIEIKMEQEFLQYFSCPNLPPFHVGWTCHNGVYNQFGYFNGEKNYGNAIQMWPKEKMEDFDWELPFTAVPLEVSIPLFAYDLFSIIKHFIPGYPSRISPTESYIAVRKKKKKLIFMSLSGKANEKIAEAYCGMFSRYDYDPALVRYGGGGLPPQLAEIYPTRVHDGVIILKAPYKNYWTLEEYDLLCDACCLCLNAQFDQTPNEISLRADSAPDKATLDKINFIVTGMIKGVVADLTRRYKKTRDDYSIQWANDLAERFDDLYKIACNSLKIQPEFCGKAYWKELLTRSRNISWDVVSDFNNILHGHFRELKTEPNYKPALQRENFEVNKPRSTIVSGSEMVDKAYLHFQKYNRTRKREIEKKVLDKIIWLDDAKYIMGNCPNQYIYLYAAIRSFCMYLDITEGKKEFSKRLLQWTHQVLTDLSNQTVDILNILSQYLSKKVESEMIICSRTTQEREISGWYDNKKHLIYLPYENYYHDFVKYWNETYKYAFPYTQEKFQKKLIEQQVLVVHESQRKGSYSRCQCRVVVDPPIEDRPSVQRPVLKVDVGKLTLSPEAMQQLQEMDKIIVSRRRKSVRRRSILDGLSGILSTDI